VKRGEEEGVNKKKTPFYSFFSQSEA